MWNVPVWFSFIKREKNKVKKEESKQPQLNLNFNTVKKFSKWWFHQFDGKRVTAKIKIEIV